MSLMDERDLRQPGHQLALFPPFTATTQPEKAATELRGSRQALRLADAEREQPASEIVREALRSYLRIED